MTEDRPRGAAALQPIRALCFDVFGTVVDWYGSISEEVQAMGLPVEAGALALAWRAGYQPALQEVRDGRLPWTNVDGLHRRILDRLLAELSIRLEEEQAQHLNQVWHRLKPWPDAVSGLHQLKASYTITTLSNGHVALLLNMAKRAGLPWDTVLSAELFNHYKPDPEVYQGAARLLGLQHHEVLMVAAHPSDLRGAKRAGLATALVPRPLERGPGGSMAPWQDGEFDTVAQSFEQLAQQLAQQSAEQSAEQAHA